MNLYLLILAALAGIATVALVSVFTYQIWWRRDQRKIWVSFFNDATGKFRIKKHLPDREGFRFKNYAKEEAYCTLDFTHNYWYECWRAGPLYVVDEMTGVQIPRMNCPTDYPLGYMTNAHLSAKLAEQALRSQTKETTDWAKIIMPLALAAMLVLGFVAWMVS